MTTTMATFAAQLSALSISGVSRQFAYRPISLDAADLPASFPYMPEGGVEGGGEWASTCSGTSTYYTGELAVAVKPVGLSTAKATFDAVIAMQDALIAAGNAWTDPALVTLTTRSQVVPVGDSEFICAILRVEARYLD